MDLRETVRVLHAVRTDEVVIASMGTAREWTALGEAHPLDLVHVPSSMGQATSLGLGIALACPQRRVVVCMGDGSMLMNLGSLVTITAQAPGNLTVLLFDNGVYEVTGSQPTPGAARGRRDGQGIDLGAIARGCGFVDVREYADLETWRADVTDVLAREGPTFTLLRVAPLADPLPPRSPGPARDRAIALARALQG